MAISYHCGDDRREFHLLCRQHAWTYLLGRSWRCKRQEASDECFARAADRIVSRVLCHEWHRRAHPCACRCRICRRRTAQRLLPPAGRDVGAERSHQVQDHPHLWLGDRCALPFTVRIPRARYRVVACPPRLPRARSAAPARHSAMARGEPSLPSHARTTRRRSRCCPKGRAHQRPAAAATGSPSTSEHIERQPKLCAARSPAPSSNPSLPHFAGRAGVVRLNLHLLRRTCCMHGVESVPPPLPMPT